MAAHCCCSSGEAMCVECMKGAHRICAERSEDACLADPARRAAALDRLIDAEIRAELRS